MLFVSPAQAVFRKFSVSRRVALDAPIQRRRVFGSCSINSAWSVPHFDESDKQCEDFLLYAKIPFRLLLRGCAILSARGPCTRGLLLCSCLGYARWYPDCETSDDACLTVRISVYVPDCGFFSPTRQQKMRVQTCCG